MNLRKDHFNYDVYNNANSETEEVLLFPFPVLTVLFVAENMLPRNCLIKSIGPDIFVRGLRRNVVKCDNHCDVLQLRVEYEVLMLS